MAEQHEILSDDVKNRIKETFFDKLKDDVAIEVFTLPGMNDQYNEATVGLVRSLAGLSSRLKPTFHTIGDEQARKRDVTRSPSILVAPDRFRMRFTGAPLGEEGKALLVSILMASTGRTVLSEETVRRLAELKERRDIRVFVSPT